MRGLRDRKGFSLVELLVVLVIVSFILLLIAGVAFHVIDDAQETAAAAQARSVYMAAQIVMAEAAGDIRDSEYEEGLSGTAGTFGRPGELSQKMIALLAPNVELAGEPGDGKSAARFTVEDGVIAGLVYETAFGRRVYAVTMGFGRETAAERVR